MPSFKVFALLAICLAATCANADDDVDEDELLKQIHMEVNKLFAQGVEWKEVAESYEADAKKYRVYCKYCPRICRTAVEHNIQQEKGRRKGYEICENACPGAGCPGDE